MTPGLPTVVLCLRPDGTIQAEAPGANGTRVKLDDSLLRNLPPQYQDSLVEQQNRLRRKAQDEALERNRWVFNYVAETHNHGSESGEAFARRTVGRTVRTPQGIRNVLARSGFSKAEIDLMESRGELTGSAFFSSIETEDRIARMRETGESTAKVKRAKSGPVDLSQAVDITDLF